MGNAQPRRRPDANGDTVVQPVPLTETAGKRSKRKSRIKRRYSTPARHTRDSLSSADDSQYRTLLPKHGNRGETRTVTPATETYPQSSPSEEEPDVRKPEQRDSLTYSNIHYEFAAGTFEREVFVRPKGPSKLDTSVECCLIEPAPERPVCHEVSVQTGPQIEFVDCGIMAKPEVEEAGLCTEPVVVLSADLTDSLPPSPKSIESDTPALVEAWPTPPPESLFENPLNPPKLILHVSKECQTLPEPIQRAQSCGNIPVRPTVSQEPEYRQYCVCCQQECGDCVEPFDWQYAPNEAAYMLCVCGDTDGARATSKSVNDLCSALPQPRFVNRRRSEGSTSSYPQASEPCSAMFYLKATDKVNTLLTDRSDRRMRTVCEKFQCELQLRGRGLKGGFVQYAVEIEAPNLVALQSCVRNLDTALGLNLRQQLKVVGYSRC